MHRSLILGLLLLAAPASAEQYRLGLITPPPHQWTITAESIAAQIKDATDGRVEILVMPSGQLGNEARILQQLQTGAIDFALLTSAEFANRSDDYGVFYAPYLAKDTQDAARLLRGEVAGELLDGMGDFGLHGLAWGMAGMRQVVTAGEVHEAADLDGLRIRTVPLAPEMAFWSLLGAAPTPMPLPALYDAFANGQVDAMQIDHEGTWNSGYYKNAGTILDSRHMIFPMAAVASSRKWQSISADDRASIDAIFKAQIAAMVDLYGEIDAINLARLRETDVPVIEVGREWFGAAVDDWYTEWRAKTPLLARLEAEAAQ
ncbi:TRAP transporter substrate-binding protein [Citreicella sp. C3M06]|uniref:TRAP transporter substrate-binding protein n=1 Tax=Citreicella sp. C3M06 TaxID=2841564 RepID=UPI00209073F9|nr:TRAP transporter substrate-binding protein [Citreicella sp. C3M06]